MMKRQCGSVELVVTAFIVLGIIALFAFFIFAWPLINVWRSGLTGEAELRRAEQTRQILITQAKAEEEAAVHRSKAIHIMGEAAKKYPEYRQQEFIGAFAEAMHNGRINQIIYVPTEAGIPILEAGKRH
jgi:regulator of protease activity HflC (stomatin/prohibitin superfamily)